MLKVTYRDLRDHAFRTAAGKLYNYGGYKDVRVTRDVARLVKLLDKYNTEGEDLIRKIAKDYAEVDEKGEVKVNDQGAFRILDEKAEEWKNKIKEFLDTEVEISSAPLKLLDLSGCALSPHELNALEPLLAKLEPVG